MSTRYAYTDEKKAHLHTLDDKPLLGTSTVCGIVGKGDALSWWAAELAAVEALTSGAVYPTLREEYKDAKALADIKLRKGAMDALQKKYPAFRAARFAHYKVKNDAADTGIDLHAELEHYVKECLRLGGVPQFASSVRYPNQVVIFSKWAVENVKRFLWSEAHCYSEKLWVGGITDCGAEMKDSKIAVIDFKSSKDAYFGQFVQTGGYALEIAENGLFDAQGNKTGTLERDVTVLYIVPFGAEDPTPRPHYDVEGRMEDFRCAARLYKSSQLEEFNK